MSSKNFIDKLRTTYRNFYRPLRIDVAIKRREVLSILYAISAFCLFLTLRSKTYLMRDELSKIKPDPVDDSWTFRYVNGELTQIIKREK